MRRTADSGGSARVERGLQQYDKGARTVTFRILFATLLTLCLVMATTAEAQIASPAQSGHYSPVMMNVRDMAHPPPGLFVLWYNAFLWSDSYVDRNGDRIESIPGLVQNTRLDLKLDAFASVPTIFWASHFRILGGARYMVGISPNIVSADISAVTERIGIINPDATFIREHGQRNSGFSDLFVTPVGLSWGWERADVTAFYSFYAPTGKYETGDPESIGLGFWTHQLQAFGYFYPRPDKSTAVVLGLTQEFNGKIEDVDVSPGNRFTLEWGLSQYFSERFEVSVQGGHNWQVSDDDGADVYWDAGYHDRKSTMAFGATYWPWNTRLAITAKYAFDFGVRQRFDNNTMFVNLLFVPAWLTGGA